MFHLRFLHKAVNRCVVLPVTTCFGSSCIKAIINHSAVYLVIIFNAKLKRISLSLFACPSTSSLHIHPVRYYTVSRFFGF